MNHEVQFIINPSVSKSGWGKVAFEMSQFAPNLKVRETIFPFEEVVNFSENVIICGGDGTVSGVLEEIYRKEGFAENGPVLGVTKTGAGGIVYSSRMIEGAVCSAKNFLNLKRDNLVDKAWYRPATVNDRIFVSGVGMGQFETALADFDGELGRTRGGGIFRLERAAIMALGEVSRHGNSELPFFHSVLTAPYSQVGKELFEERDMTHQLIEVSIGNLNRDERFRKLLRILMGFKFGSLKLLPSDCIRTGWDFVSHERPETINLDGEFMGVKYKGDEDRFYFKRATRPIPLVALV